MPTRTNLSPAESDRVVGALERRARREHGGNVSALARELGITQATLSRTMNREHGASLATAKALAQVEGVTVESILKDPRELAADIAREGGVPETAVRRVLEEPEPDERKPALYWIHRMLAFAALDEAPPTTGMIPTVRRKQGVA